MATGPGALRPLWIGMAACPLAASAAAGDLPVGAPAEDGPLGLALRIGALLLGTALLLGGRRFDRAAVGALALLLGLAVGLGALGSLSYGAGLLAGWLFFAVATLFYAFAPRVAVGAACLWPLPAFYLASVLLAGAFDFSKPLVLGLVVAGAALGAAAPAAGVALVSAAAGAFLLFAAFPGEMPFWALAALGAGGFLWQVALLPLFAGGREDWPGRDSLSAKRERWLKGCRAGLAAVVLLAFAAALLAPRVLPAGPGGAAREAAVRAAGGLARPGLLVDPVDALYLGGRAVRLGLAGGTGRFWDRLALPVLGKDPSREVRRLRAVKSPQELDAMRRAAAITSKAMAAAAAAVRPGASERDVERAVLEAYAREGANGVAFPSVVGSGRNATAPHYMRNDAVMEGGLVVVDIGCSVDGYASDMTRTFPVVGRCTEAERKLLETAVAAGDAARSLLKAGASYAALDRAAREVIEKAGFGDYILHGLGHGVGLDVHDPTPDALEAGMVVTLEPGIYIPAGSAAPREYWDLGVRVEDSYLVTATGYEELTSGPKIPCP